MGQPEHVNAEYYGSASSTSSIGVGDAAINVRARAPYRIRHRGVFIGLISTIFILCLGNLAVSLFICGIIDPHSTYYDSVTMGSYTPGPTISMVRFVFFWITIPTVLTALSLYELIQIARNRLPSRWIAGSAVVAGVIWGVQMTLEGICMWGLPTPDILSRSNMCLWRYSTNGGWEDWDLATTMAWIAPWLIIPIVCMYIMYFSVGMRAVVIDKRDLKEQNALAAPKEDSLSLHTLSTSPVAETLVTNSHPSTHAATRPPSYFSSGAASFDSYDVKKD